MKLISTVLVGIAFILWGCTTAFGLVLNPLLWGIYLLITGIICIVEALTGDLRSHRRNNG